MMRHSPQLWLPMTPSSSVLCAACQKLPELVFKRLSSSLKIQNRNFLIPSCLLFITSRVIFKVWLQMTMEDEPKQCSCMKRKKKKNSAYANQKSQLSSQRVVKRTHHLNAFQLNHLSCFLHTGQCSVVLSMQRESFQSLPNHEASCFSCEQALLWGTNKNDIPLHKAELRMSLWTGPMKNSERIITLHAIWFYGKQTKGPLNNL